MQKSEFINACSSIIREEISKDDLATVAQVTNDSLHALFHHLSKLPPDASNFDFCEAIGQAALLLGALSLRVLIEDLERRILVYEFVSTASDGEIENYTTFAKVGRS